jgi:hypothetical protein
MRVYHNLSTDDQMKYLCPLRCSSSVQHENNVDLCHVDSIRTNVINSALIQRLNPRMWRFLVMLDPLVDRFMCRDIDSDIIPREVTAVHQWLQSNFTFHVMYDVIGSENESNLSNPADAMYITVDANTLR